MPRYVIDSNGKVHHDQALEISLKRYDDGTQLDFGLGKKPISKVENRGRPSLGRGVAATLRNMMEKF